MQSVKCIYMNSPSFFLLAEKISCQMLNRKRSGAAAVSINAALGLNSCAPSFFLVLSPQTDSSDGSKWWQADRFTAATIILYCFLFLLPSFSSQANSSLMPALFVSCSVDSQLNGRVSLSFFFHTRLLSLFNKSNSVTISFAAALPSHISHHQHATPFYWQKKKVHRHRRLLSFFFSHHPFPNIIFTCQKLHHTTNL